MILQLLSWSITAKQLRTNIFAHVDKMSHFYRNVFYYRVDKEHGQYIHIFLTCQMEIGKIKSTEFKHSLHMIPVSSPFAFNKEL